MPAQFLLDPDSKAQKLSGPEGPRSGGVARFSIMVSASIPSYMSVVYGCIAQRLLLTRFKENREDKGGLHSVNSLEETGVLFRETNTHTQFFQSVVSSADLSTDRSTSPYDRSLVSRRPLHRHGPSAVFKALPKGQSGQ